ncbi:protein LAZY 1-like [Impatiens glandulifera]|uniref:protein LAZY 1-like n=1 Tax=Impatiens glandulifera TaxID=253017 RepID=UPI001FB186A7|nr:protein LAZY 1-like [Impatiens glandulifera]
MKLLGWMHRKNRSIEPLKDFSIGQPSLDDQHLFSKSNYGNKPSGKSQRDNYLRRSFASLQAARVEEDEFEEETSSQFSDIFHGFLTIGTLGSDQVTTDPSTPTFTISVENITQKETEVTENELKLINDELEKELGAEDGYTDSSGRNSHASNGRSSHASNGRSSHASNGRSSHGSTITLNAKLMDGPETNGTAVCPLQGYLFGSTFELPEPTIIKKVNRTSLGELFQKAKIAEETSGIKCEREEKQTDKEADKSAKDIMKRMLKKGIAHASSRNSGITGGNVDLTAKETKLQKIMHMFNKKVHPESSTAIPTVDKPVKNEIKSIICERNYKKRDGMFPDDDITIFPTRALSKECVQCFKNHSNSTHVTMCASDSNGNRECWIKTDADYLVLEL